MSDELKKIVILVLPKTYKGRTSRVVTLSQSPSLALITLYLGTSGKFTHSAGVAMERDKDNKWRIVLTSLKTTGKKSSKNSKPADGK